MKYLYVRKIHFLLFLVSFFAGNTLWAVPTGGDDPANIIPSPFFKLLPTRVFPKIPLKSPEGEVYQKNQTTDVFELVKNSKFNVKTNQIISFDPVRFAIQAKSDSILLGREIELTIKAEFLDVSPRLMFTDEGSNEFTLKMLFPKEFIVTGGSYYDYIKGKVSRESPIQTFTVKGYFETIIPNAEFRLLRSHSEATSNDYFVVKSAINFKQVKNKEIFLLENPDNIDKSNNRLAETQSIQNCFGDFKIAVSTSASGSCQLANGELLRFVGVSCPSPATITWYKRGDSDIASQVASIGSGLTFQNAFDPTKQIYFAKCSDGVCSKTTNEINFVFREYISPNGYPSTLSEQRFYCPTSPTPQILTASCVPGLPNWSNGSTANTITVTSATPTTYSYTCTRSACTANPAAPTYYQYVIIENCSGGNGCTPFVVNASSNSPNQEVTPTANLNLSVTTPDPLATFIWTGPNNFYSTAKNPVRINTISAMSGTYTVTVTNSTGCISTATTSVSLNVIPCVTPPAPRIDARTINKTNCTPLEAGDTVELVATNCPYTVTWGGGQTGSVLQITMPAVVTSYTAKCVDRTCESPVSNITLTPNISSAGYQTSPYQLPCNGSIIITATCLPGIPVWADGTQSTTYLAKQPGNYTFQCKSGTCLASSTGSISVISQAGIPPTIAANKTVICGTSPVTITASNCTGTVNWSGTGITASTTGLTYTTATAGNYSAICSTPCGDSNPSNAITLTSAPALNVTASSNSPSGQVIVGQILSLTASSTDANITYNWTGSNNYSANIAAPNITSASLLSSGVYTVTITNAGGCSATATTNVTVSNSAVCQTPKAPVLITKVLNQALCGYVTPGEMIELSATGCDFEVVWEASGTFTTAKSFQIPMPAVQTIYKAKCIDRTCQSSEGTTYLTPNALTITSPATFQLPCNGQLTLTASCMPGTPIWQSNGSVSNSLTVNAVGSYTFQCKNGTCPPFGSTTLTVINEEFPKPSITSNGSGVCSGSTLTLTATGCSGSVLWNASGVTSTTVGNTNAITSGGTYTAQCFNACTTGLVSNPLTISSLTGFTLSASSNSSIVAGQTLSLSATTNPNTNVNIFWSGPNGFSAPGLNQSISNATLQANGIYTVSATSASSGCTATATTNVLVLNANCPVKPPTLSVSTNKTVIPFGGAVTLTAQSCAGTILWTANAYDDPNNIPRVQKSTFTSNPVNGVSVVTVNPPGNALSDHAPSVVYTAQCLVNGCLSDSTAISQVVIQLTDFPCLPPDKFDVIGGSNRTESIINGASNQKWKEIKIEVCPTESYTLTATGCTGTVAWGGFFAVTTSYPAGGTSRTVQASAMQADEVTYTVSCPADFCPSPNANIYIKVIRKSVALTADNNSKNGEIAVGGTVNLSAISTATGLTYAWAGPNNFSSTLANPIISSATVTINGTYTVTATNTAGCSASATTGVAISSEFTTCSGLKIKSTNPVSSTETLTLNRNPTNTNQYLPLTLSVELTGTGSTIGYTYSWVGPDGVTFATPTNATQNINKPGLYIVNLLKNGVDCSLEIEIAGSPCIQKNTTYTTCKNVTIISPINVNLVQSLSTGSKFYAADYLVEVIEPFGDANGWSGTGKVEVVLLSGLKANFSVDFDNIQINDCYELVNGTVKVSYDPTWGNIVDLDGIIKDFKELKNSVMNDLTTLQDNLQNETNEVSLEQQLLNLLDKIDKHIESIQKSSKLTQQEKDDLIAKLNQIKAILNSYMVCTPNSNTNNANARIASIQCGDLKQEAIDKTKAMIENLNGYTCNCAFGECKSILTVLELIRDANIKNRADTLLKKVDNKTILTNNVNWTSLTTGIDIGNECYKIELYFNFSQSETTLFLNKYQESTEGFNFIDNNNVVLLYVKIVETSSAEELTRKKAVLKDYLKLKDPLLIPTLKVYANPDGKVLIKLYVPKSIEQGFKDRYTDLTYSQQVFPIKVELYDANSIKRDLGQFEYIMTENLYPNQSQYGTTKLVDLIDIRLFDNIVGIDITMNPNTNRFYTNLSTMGSFLGLMMTNNNSDFTFNGGSNHLGLSIGGSKTHKNGTNCDIRILRKNNQIAPSNICTGSDYLNVDTTRHIDFNNTLKKYGWNTILSNHSLITLHKTKNDTAGRHCDHLHLESYTKNTIFKIIYE